jgi:hypothetical protein
MTFFSSFPLNGSTPVSKMATWIAQQLDEEVTAPTSHREFFRKHGNAQFERSSKYGQVTHPCQANAMLRKFALSYKHKDKFLEIATVLNGTKIALSVGGSVLTVVDAPVLFTTSALGFTDTAMANLSSIDTDELADGR